MAGSSSSMNMLVVMALFVVILTCVLVAVHMHPEYIESVKNWFSHTVSMPRI
jgi:vacuolar-type H+-ATPase subunit I/STV1